MGLHVILITAIVNVFSGSFSMSLNEWNSLRSLGDKRIDAVKVAVYALLSFAIGALLPIIPLFMFPLTDAISNSAILCGCAVLLVGAFASRVSKKEMLHAGLRSLGVGVTMAILTYICATCIPYVLQLLK